MYTSGELNPNVRFHRGGLKSQYVQMEWISGWVKKHKLHLSFDLAANWSKPEANYLLRLKPPAEEFSV